MYLASLSHKPCLAIRGLPCVLGVLISFGVSLATTHSLIPVPVEVVGGTES